MWGGAGLLSQSSYIFSFAASEAGDRLTWSVLPRYQVYSTSAGSPRTRSVQSTSVLTSSSRSSSRSLSRSASSCWFVNFVLTTPPASVPPSSFGWIRRHTRLTVRGPLVICSLDLPAVCAQSYSSNLMTTLQIMKRMTKPMT